MAKNYIPNTRDYLNDIWSHKSGEVGFQDSWDSGRYAQQIKASGPINSKYDDQFAALSKGESKVDDDGEWVTLKNQSNSDPNVRQEFEALSNEWKNAGYDVRVQDLDNSDGAKWADIAVRKGPGGKTSEAEVPIQLSDRAAEAKAYTGAYEKVMLPRQGDYVIKDDQSVINDFDTEYNLQLNKAKQPYMADGSDMSDIKQAEATEYANDYKKAVADTLFPKVSF